MKKYLYTCFAACLSAITLQSCFQDMDRPAFDYPESGAAKEYSPVKMFLPFDDNVRDKGNYTFLMTDYGEVTFTEGVAGKAYQGTKDSYVLARTPGYLGDTVPNLGSCTVAFWMKAVKNTTAQGLFSIPNEVKFWGNFDIFLENHNSETQAFFKMHIFNQTSKENDERWVEAKIDDVFGDQWVHMAFVYDGAASAVTIYRNGEAVFTKELPGCGKLKFSDVGPALAIGAFQFSTKPSLTTGAGAQTWAANFPGRLDQFRFYDTVVPASEIRRLYSEKE